MLDVASPLASAQKFSAPGIEIEEDAGFTLTQVAGFGKTFEKDLATALGKLPTKVGIAHDHSDHVVFRVGPQQFWCVAQEQLMPLPATCLVTQLSSSRCRIAIAGEKARALLARCAAIDFDTRSFKPGHFVMTGIHHTPVLIHCISDNRFHLYALRTFALGVWEWLVDVAEGLDNARHS